MNISDNGISYSIQFKAQFYEDMKPEILADFNDLNKQFINDNQLYYKNPSAKTYHRTRSDGKLHDYGVYNSILGRIDNRPAIGAHVEKALSTNSKRASISPNKYIYKLHWRGVERY